MKAYVDDCETHFLNSVKFLKQKVTWFISDFFIMNTFIRRNADGKKRTKKKQKTYCTAWQKYAQDKIHTMNWLIVLSFISCTYSIKECFSKWSWTLWHNGHKLSECLCEYVAPNTREHKHQKQKEDGGCIHIDTSMSPGIRVQVIVNMNLHVFQWSRSH